MEMYFWKVVDLKMVLSFSLPLYPVARMTTSASTGRVASPSMTRPCSEKVKELDFLNTMLPSSTLL